MLVLLGSVLISIVSSPYEITRLRNSLIADPGQDSDFDWAPNNVPDEFQYETVGAPRDLTSILGSAVKVPGKVGSFEAGLSIARHLASGPGPGAGIMSDTLTTYKTIMTDNRGYCSDYTQVFNGFAIAADLPVREWGMSFDGYSGDGHAFNEIYHDGLGKWVLIDSFYSLYVTDTASGIPLSVLEFRDRLLAGASTSEIRVVPIVKERYSFKSETAVLEYYRSGADQMFLWFGNDVFSYDAAPGVRIAGQYSRALEQAIAIILGDHPRLKLIVSKENSKLIRRLQLIRYTFIAGTVISFSLMCVLLYQFRLWVKQRLLQRL